MDEPRYIELIDGARSRELNKGKAFDRQNHLVHWTWEPRDWLLVDLNVANEIVGIEILGGHTVEEALRAMSQEGVIEITTNRWL